MGIKMIQACRAHDRWKIWSIFFCCALFLVSGCASGKLIRARHEFYRGHINKASDILSGPEGVSGRDRLLFYMEKGLILHYDGQYQKSIDTLLQASALMAEQEVISAGQQAGSLVTSERITDYKGEYAERLWVHTYLIMDYLMIGDYDDALVEAKQALKVYETYPEACSGDYFTRALIAHCYEAVGEINDAYIEYKKLAELMGDPAPVADRLYAIGERLGFYDEVNKYRKFLSKEDIRRIEKDHYPEVIIFIGQGRSPIKIPKNIVVPPSIRFSFSTYRDRTRHFFQPVIKAPPGPGPMSMVTTSIGDVLKASLKKRMLKVIAKETARTATKEVIARKMKDPVAEALVRIAFFLMEEPDTRCWQTLPAYITMVRAPVSPGTGQVYLSNFNGGGNSIRLPVLNGRSKPYYYYSVRDSYLADPFKP